MSIDGVVSDLTNGNVNHCTTGEIYLKIHTSTKTKPKNGLSYICLLSTVIISYN